MPKIKDWKNLRTFSQSQIELIESLEREYESEIEELQEKNARLILRNNQLEDEVRLWKSNYNEF